MSLFQKSVLSNYLDSVSDSDIDKGWSSIQSYKEMASKVQSFKEEEFQADFLTIIFADCFGYISNYKSGAEGNLFFEQKNKVGSKKADGTIIKDGEVIAVIELKSTKTKNLDDVKNQAFGYYTNNSKCEYVITSNFNKLRFYIERNEDYLEFDLFNIDREEFKILWLCLDSKNLLEGKPKEIKNKSLISEENITKKLYQDYSTFRQELFNDLVENNQTVEKRVILNKTQKLLDRLLFILFSEDRGLLPANSISEIINHWEFGGDSLYSTFLTYFEIINKGRPKRGDKKGIYAYNGGLFSEDVVLNTLNISDDVLLSNAKKLTKYDFESDVSVDILGHIFEHSLSEIEELQNQIDGVETDKSKSKRKKDGVYYTPKYITKYIVDNTLGKLCDEKKIELDINEETYSPSAKRSRNRISALDDYRSWLLQLTICDPACGSGAFLIQALNFLIKEHRYIDELSASYNKDSLLLSDVKNSILENNLYGVDINQESVEIAKLSLWLNTAESNRKLTSLNNNIKCGNSLIDDPEVAGDKAFNWQNEFPNVFKSGGFDVVMGNPPYVDIKALDKDFVKALFNEFKTTENRINLYSVFIEKGYFLLKSKGFLSFINPNSILVNSSYTKIRKMLLDDVTTIIKLPDDVFKDASVETIIFEFRKHYSNDIVKTVVYKKNEKINYVDGSKTTEISKSNWKHNENWNFNIYVSKEQFQLLGKISSNTKKLVDIADFSLGITPYDKYRGHSEEVIKSRAFHSNTKTGIDYKPLISGGNINRYLVSDEVSEYIKYGDWLGASREEKFFKSPRVLIRQIVSGKPPRIYAGFTEKSLYYTQIGFGIIPKPETISVKSLLALINSSLINFYHKYSFLDLEKELFQKILIANCKRFPIPKLLFDNPRLFNQLVDEIIEFKTIENDVINNFIELLLFKFSISKPSKKLQNWANFDFGEFLNELKTLKVKLGIDDLNELKQDFKSQKEKAQGLKNQINQTDKEIDQMVYELYGLTKEEIEIVENS